jgi:hypothetical protein
VTGGFDQNIALGDIDGNGRLAILATQDNAFMSLHRGTGEAFDAAPIFKKRKKFLGIRFFQDYALSQQGWAEDEDAATQAHFTNSAPAIADHDGDGTYELIVLGSMQNASQTDRTRGVALWVLNADGTRPPGWEEPFRAPGYLAGLWDFDGVKVATAYSPAVSWLLIFLAMEHPNWFSQPTHPMMTRDTFSSLMQAETNCTKSNFQSAGQWLSQPSRTSMAMGNLRSS